jgi:dTDP-4-amino-4,6-dideoxygalactose transaminase
MSESVAISMLDLRAQYHTIRDEIKRAIEDVLESQHFILGPQVTALEQEVAGYCGSRFGVGVGSGTDALVLGMSASGIGPGDEVIVPSFTFIATADCVIQLGAVPAFVDIQSDTYCMDASKIEAKITKRTKAIIPVHLYGHTAEMDSIRAIAQRNNLVVVEDNAQAIGATYKGKRSGSLGDIGCLSFFPSKNLGGYGDGGMVVTDSQEVAVRLRSLRAHGAREKYLSVEQGWNSRLDEIQAAVLRVKLRHLESWAEGRRGRAALYNTLLSNVEGVLTPFQSNDCTPVYHQYTIRVKHRDTVQKIMREHQVPTMVYYPHPIHLQPIYRALGYKTGDLRETERACEEVLSLPIYPEMSDDQVARVADVLKSAVEEAR